MLTYYLACSFRKDKRCVKNATAVECWSLWICSSFKEFKDISCKKGSDEGFSSFVVEATLLSQEIQVLPEFPVVCKSKKPRMFDYDLQDENIDDPKRRFKIGFFLSILDISIN